jgi:maleamate amidohydrolase
MKTALLIVDMQNDFFVKEEIIKQKEQLVKNVNELIDLVRLHNIPIIWIRQILKADLSNSPKHMIAAGSGIVIENTEGSELINGLSKSEGDYEVVKTRYSGFFKTDLEDLLSKLDIDTIIICGVNTHACIRMTAIDAWQRDFNVIISKDSVSSYDQEHHNVTLRYFEPTIAKVKTNKEIIELINNRF